jgi:hypothetical protein
MGTQLSCGIQAGDHQLFFAVDFDTSIAGQESCCGSDAFYRDSFLEYTEPPLHNGRLSTKAFEQAKLKAKKGKVFVQHAVTSVKSEAIKLPTELKRLPHELKKIPSMLKRQSSTATDSVQQPGETSPCVDYGRVISELEPDQIQSLSDWQSTSAWAGKTIPLWTGEALQSPKIGPCWKKGDGKGLPVRDIGYKRTKASVHADEHMYDCLTLDGIRSDVILEDIIGRVIDTIPPPSKGSLWTPECPLPRVICINLKLPYYNPKNPWAQEDGGCSFCGFFEISNATILHLNEENPPASVRLFRKFCEGPTGRPGNLKDPSRSLSLRQDKGKTKDLNTGIFKAAGWCENEDELGVPQFLRQFNGKSFVITESGYVVKDPAGEWMELGFDVRQFPILFKDALYTFRDFLPKAQYHCGFLIQATEDEDLPEGLLCDLYLSGVNIKNHPWKVAHPY